MLDTSACAFAESCFKLALSRLPFSWKSDFNLSNRSLFVRNVFHAAEVVVKVRGKRIPSKKKGHKMRFLFPWEELWTLKLELLDNCNMSRCSTTNQGGVFSFLKTIR